MLYINLHSITNVFHKTYILQKFFQIIKWIQYHCKYYLTQQCHLGHNHILLNPVLYYLNILDIESSVVVVQVVV